MRKIRALSQTEREKGTYLEELIRTYFRYESKRSAPILEMLRQIVR